MPISLPQLLQLGLLQPSDSTLLYPPGLSGATVPSTSGATPVAKNPQISAGALGRGSVAWRGYSIGMPQQGQANASISSPSFPRRT
jgi:hypothetical protein